MIDLTDLQEDILTLAIKHPDMTNGEIADVLNCSEEYVGEVRRDYEHAVDESKVDNELNTIRRNARDVNMGNGGILDALILKPLVLTLTFSFWALETSFEESFWLLEKGVGLMFWLIELPFRLLDVITGPDNK